MARRGAVASAIAPPTTVSGVTPDLLSAICEPALCLLRSALRAPRSALALRPRAPRDGTWTASGTRPACRFRPRPPRSPPIPASMTLGRSPASWLISSSVSVRARSAESLPVAAGGFSADCLAHHVPHGRRRLCSPNGWRLLLAPRRASARSAQAATLNSQTSLDSSSAVLASSWAEAAVSSVDAEVCSVDAETC